jgi:hypothetical protein
LKIVPATQLGSGASTSRHRAPARRTSSAGAGRTSACVPPRAFPTSLRPRRSFPMHARAPPGSGSPPSTPCAVVSAPYAPSAPRTAGPTTASPPYARPPRTGTTTASSSSPRRHPRAEPSLFKRRPSPLRVPLSLHPAIAATALSSRPRSRSPPANYPTSFPRPQCTSRGHALPSYTPSSPSPRAAVATAAGHRRSPMPAAPPPQLRPPVDPR